MTDIRQNNPQPRSEIDRLQDPGDVFKNTAQAEYMRQFIRVLSRVVAAFVSKDTAAAYFHLSSPSGKVYKITVADDGTLVQTYIRG